MIEQWNVPLKPDVYLNISLVSPAAFKNLKELARVSVVSDDNWGHLDKAGWWWEARELGVA